MVAAVLHSALVSVYSNPKSAVRTAPQVGTRQWKSLEFRTAIYN